MPPLLNVCNIANENALERCLCVSSFQSYSNGWMVNSKLAAYMVSLVRTSDIFYDLTSPIQYAV